jgi:hypothetical protein
LDCPLQKKFHHYIKIKTKLTKTEQLFGGATGELGCLDKLLQLRTDASGQKVYGRTPLQTL